MADNELKSWLATKRLNNIVDALVDQGIDCLDDIKRGLRSMDDLNLIVEKMRLMKVPANKFKKAVVELNNIPKQTTASPPSQPKPGNQRHDHGKKEEDGGLKSWLDTLRLPQYYSSFTKAGYHKRNDLKRGVTEQALIDMGIRKKPHLRRILKAISEIIDEEPDEEPDEMKLWLTNTVKLPQYCSLFINAGYDDMSYLDESVQDADLIEVGIKVEEHRRTILNAIKSLGQSSVPPGVHQVERLHSLKVDQRHRTIVVMSWTGCDKIPLLNSMMNYLWEVEYDDNYRFKLISQREYFVTAYHLAPPALEYQLKLIDIPEFGDILTLGLEQDKQIRKFFEEEKIQEIDALCFVIPAHQAQLTTTQNYMFTQVLSNFGKDLADNILILMTLADDKKPPALAALKMSNVPFTSHFEFNHSAFDLPEDDEDDMMGRIFWKMSISSFSKLFKAIDQLKTQSLGLTKQVMKRHVELEHSFQSVPSIVGNGSTIFEKIRQQMKETNEPYSGDRIIEEAVTEYDQVDKQLDASTNSVNSCVKELAESALRPYALSQDDYIDKLIQYEEVARKQGYQQRIRILNQLKEKQDKLRLFKKGHFYNPWPQYQVEMEKVGKSMDERERAQKQWHHR
eukprot:908074_1